MPKGNWALVPNPVVKLTKTGGFMGKNNVASLERDMMARKSAAAVTLYAGDDDDEKRYKVKLSGKDVDVLGSLEGVARAKLWKRWVLISTFDVRRSTFDVRRSTCGGAPGCVRLSPASERVTIDHDGCSSAEGIEGIEGIDILPAPPPF